MPTIYWFREAALVLAIGWALWAWWRARGTGGSMLPWLGAIAMFAMAVEIIGLLTTLQRANNSILYNCSTYLEFLLQLGMARAYHRPWSAMLGTLAGVGTIAWVASMWLHGPFDFLLIEGILAFSVILVYVSLIALWHTTTTSEQALHKTPAFWVFGGMLLYHGSLLPVLTIIHYVFRNDDVLASWLWYIPPLLCVLRYCCHAVACKLMTGDRAHG